MKRSNLALILKVILLLAVCFAVYYALAAWAIWVVSSLTGVTGSTFFMMLFLIVVSHILTQKYSGLPVMLLIIATLYIWTLL